MGLRVIYLRVLHLDIFTTVLAPTLAIRVVIGINIKKSPKIRNYPTISIDQLTNKTINKKKIENKLPLLLTLFYACFGLFRFFAQGPFYLRQNGDVNYVYLLTGLDYWSLQPSSINDQPALTVKLVNALNIGIVYPIRSLFIDLTMEQDVLKNSEFYMSISALLIFAILLLVFYRFIKYSYNLTADKAI